MVRPSGDHARGPRWWNGLGSSGAARRRQRRAGRRACSAASGGALTGEIAKSERGRRVTLQSAADLIVVTRPADKRAPGYGHVAEIILTVSTFNFGVEVAE